MTLPEVRTDGRVIIAVAVASAAIVALQLVLMRCLAVAWWHHFAYLVISTALLGFGASGTLLTFLGPRLARRFDAAMVTILVATAIAIPSSFALAEALPIDTYQIMLQSSHAGMLMAYHLILLVPFTLGASAIGLSLMACRGQAARVYASSLAGSGAGSACAVGLMVALSVDHLLWAVSTMAMAAGLAMAIGSLRRLIGWAVGAAALFGLAYPLSSPIRVDAYKPLAHYEQLAAQGEARLLARRDSPRGRLDVFDTPYAHYTLFASPQAEPPPPQMALAVDGGQVTPIFRIDGPAAAGVMDATPMAAIYRVFRPKRVLLLGEVGGANVWMARRFGATHVTVVQPNPQIVELLTGPLADRAGHVFEGDDVEVVVADPRGFVDRTDRRFDLIQLVALEAMAVGAPNAMGLNQSSLATVEGVGRCLDRLTPRGVVAVVRGIQEPPRDNVRLFATFVEALERRGCVEPDRQSLQYRNYLAACTAAVAEPLTSAHAERLADVLTTMAMDPVWYAGMTDDRANRIDRRRGPPGSELSFLDWTAREILTPRREALYETWSFSIRPATDDRPFSFDFFRWRSLPEYIRAFGSNWLAQTEWGYVVLVAGLGWSIVTAAVLILLPLLRLRRDPTGRGFRLATGTYYVALGAGYMLLEMALIQEFTRVLAEPVFAVAVVLSAFLAFSGLGSALAGRSSAMRFAAIWPSLAVVLALATAYALVGRWALSAAITCPMSVRVCVCLALAGVLAVPMGMPFPRGLMRLSVVSPGLIPWAWGANGFASVVAATGAVVLAMSYGFAAVVWAAIGAYTLAGVAAIRLPSMRHSVDATERPG